MAFSIWHIGLISVSVGFSYVYLSSILAIGLFGAYLSYGYIEIFREKEVYG